MKHIKQINKKHIKHVKRINVGIKHINGDIYMSLYNRIQTKIVLYINLSVISFIQKNIKIIKFSENYSHN